VPEAETGRFSSATVETKGRQRLAGRGADRVRRRGREFSCSRCKNGKQATGGGSIGDRPRDVLSKREGGHARGLKAEAVKVRCCHAGCHPANISLGVCMSQPCHTLLPCQLVRFSLLPSIATGLELHIRVVSLCGRRMAAACPLVPGWQTQRFVLYACFFCSSHRLFLTGVLTPALRDAANRALRQLARVDAIFGLYARR
jgi:hypothetical protein